MLDALVLSTSPYSETTLIVRLLSREEGVVRALAKGARRMKEQNAAAFDLFARVRVSVRLASEDRLGTIRAVELVRDWPWLRSDLRRLALASVALETLGAVAELSPPEPFFFDEACSFLERMGPAAAPGSLACALLLRLLHHAGHPPEVDVSLLEPSVGRRDAEYDFRTGTLRSAGAYDPPGAHGADAPPSEKDSRPTLRLPSDLLPPLLPALLRPPPLDAERFRLPGRTGAIALDWLVRVWEDHLHRPLRSRAFLERILSEGRRG